jgi:hypothetical protein
MERVYSFAPICHLCMFDYNVFDTCWAISMCGSELVNGGLSYLLNICRAMCYLQTARRKNMYHCMVFLVSSLQIGFG